MGSVIHPVVGRLSLDSTSELASAAGALGLNWNTDYKERQFTYRNTVAGTAKAFYNEAVPGGCGRLEKLMYHQMQKTAQKGSATVLVYTSAGGTDATSANSYYASLTGGVRERRTFSPGSTFAVQPYDVETDEEAPGHASGYVQLTVEAADEGGTYEATCTEPTLVFRESQRAPSR